jgi:hypothetical protein
MKTSNMTPRCRLGSIVGAFVLSISSQTVFAQYIGGVGAAPGLTNAPVLPSLQGVGAGTLGSNLGATLATPTGITSIGAASAVTTTAGAAAGATAATTAATTGAAVGTAGAVGATAAAVGGLSTLAVVGGVVVVGAAVAVAASGGGGGSGTTGTVAPK